MIKLIIQFLFYSIILFHLKVNAEDIESLKVKHLENVLKCAKENPLSPEQLEQINKLQKLDNENAKCLFACVYKGIGMMDNMGMFPVEIVNDLIRKLLSDNPEIFESAEKFVDACKSVNDVEVSDGDKGCERAALIFKCNLEKAPEFALVQEISMKILHDTQ